MPMAQLWLAATGALIWFIPGGPAGDDPAILLKKARYPLAEAIAKAAPQSGGGTLILAELVEDDGKAVFSLEYALGETTLEINLDAATGDLVGKETHSENKASLVRACKIPLPQALENALQKVPGLAYAVSCELKGEKPQLEVRILGDGSTSKVLFDGASGALIKVKSRKSEDARKEKKDASGDNR